LFGAACLGVAGVRGRQGWKKGIDSENSHRYQPRHPIKPTGIIPVLTLSDRDQIKAIRAIGAGYAHLGVWQQAIPGLDIYMPASLARQGRGES